MISIVIPLYNMANTIKRAVDSVLAQSVADWELVVVDDGSADNGTQLVEAYGDPRIRVIRQPNAGVSAARNHGFEAARSEIVALLDADDYWDPHHLQDLLGLIDGFPDALMFATACFVVGPEGRVRKARLGGVSSFPETFGIRDYFAIASAELPFNPSSVAIRKSTLSAVGGFPVGLVSGEDLITWARIACLGEIAYTKRPTSYYVYPEIRASQRRSAIRRPSVPDLVGAELGRLAREYTQISSSIARYLGQWYRMRAMLFLELGEGRACLSELRQAVAADRLTMKDLVLFCLLALPGDFRAGLIERVRRLRSG